MLLLAALVACSPDGTGPGGQGEEAGPTWHQDIAPIVVERCGGCHTSGGPAPFALDSFLAAGPMADAAVAAVEAGTMPPFDAIETDSCTPRRGWMDDPRLDDEEAALLREWAESGAPEGDPAEAAEIQGNVRAELDRVDRALTAESSYITSGANDEFLCVSIDAGIEEKSWVTGIDVVPGNANVVHHVVVWTDPDGESADWEDYRECGTFGGFSRSQPLLVWLPGGDPTILPEDSGVLIQRGARIVVQFHYHPAGTVADPDLSTVQIQLVTEKPEYEAVLTSFGNANDESSGLLPGPNDRREVEFRIPKNVPDHVETMQMGGQVDQEYRLFSIQPHQHYIGTGIEAHWTHDRALRDDQKDECLIQSRWNFDWQRTYYYDAPVEELPVLRPNDSVWLQCTYNNTLDNPFVVRALEDAGLEEPVNVELGEGTLDEMCLIIVGLLH